MDSVFTITPRFSVKMLEKDLRLYTPSLSEKPMADFLADKCDDLGFEDIHTDEVGNLIATKGSGSPKVLLCGHMDTVPGKIKVRKEGNYLYGRGASDAKAPLMAMLFAAATIQNNNGTIMFVGAVDEEGNAIGVKNLVTKKLDIDYAIFGEPSGLKQVTIAYKGRIAINLKVDIRKVLEEGQDKKNKGMMLTVALTEKKGGKSHNIIPQQCDAVMDIRIPVDMNCNMVEEKIANSVQEVSKKRQVDAFYSILDETEPFEAPHNSPLVRAFTLGVMDVEHTRPTLIRKTGTGDMNIIGNQLNVPVVTYGPGDPHSSHTIDEKVSIDEYLRSIEVLKHTLQHLKRLHDKRK